MGERMTRKARLGRGYDLEYFAFILPAFILFAVFFIAPFLSGFYYSLTNWNGIDKAPQFVGLRNFRRLFTEDTMFWKSFLNTMLYTAGHVILANVLAFFLALVLTRGRRIDKPLRVAFFLPNVLSMVIVGAIWSFILGQASHELAADTGLGFLGLPWLGDGRYALPSVVFVSLWQAVGWYMLIYVAGLESIPSEIKEAAVIDGASPFGLIRHVTIPLILPSITICSFLSLVNSLRVFDLVYSMTQGGPGHETESIIMNIYTTSFRSFLYGYGTAKSLVLLVVILLFSFAQVYFLKRREVEY
jgi:raffinose/stachyose/melibiose transport system permease protein